MKRQKHLAEVEEVAIRVPVENLKNGRYLGTSPDVPGPVAEGRSRTAADTVEVVDGLNEGDKIILSDMSSVANAERIHLTDEKHLRSH